MPKEVTITIVLEKDLPYNMLNDPEIWEWQLSNSYEDPNSDLQYGIIVKDVKVHPNE